MIEASQFREAYKVLCEGTGTVSAHGVGWPEDDWQEVVWIRADRGAWFACFLSSNFRPTLGRNELAGLLVDLEEIKFELEISDETDEFKAVARKQVAGLADFLENSFVRNDEYDSKLKSAEQPPKLWTQIDGLQIRK